MGRRTRGVGAHHEERRQGIADAVLAVVAERGLHAISLPTVAAQAGVSVGRVQHYFPSKDELVAVAFDRANTLSSARIRDKVGQDLETAPPRTVLRTVLTELVPYNHATRTHLRVRQSFAALALADEAVATRLRAQYAQLHSTLARLIARDQEAGRAVAPDPHATAVRLVALAEGLAYYVLTDITPADTARALVLKALADVYGTEEG
ncbi:TetR/AcrR family transcriptional regulator [Streptomyces iconiensis]|uniref:TetR/AcrR family transcriptional regulator n=1 Tax=Streptomyces iconiensis TaxID=1384038 RepID=A0ABT6ZQC7_9ACTN|nr:TetR/AcrR family transcriptional regulator [Streptomyces iconiensis]MDJ1131251.1 TetR/AcrR family transcriptional regulator [Streptomyces iconiensis]